MAREKTSMELRDIIIRLRRGHGIKQIHRDTGTHRQVIRKLKEIAEARGWIHGQEVPGEKEIVVAYHGARDAAAHPLGAFHEELVGYVKDDISYVVMYQLVGERAGVSESTLRRYVQTHVESVIHREIVERKRELSVMEVDFGRLGIVYDARERRGRVAYVFSARLRYSAKAYRDIIYDQRQETFWECHIRAFEHFGGVPERVVPDNLKAAVVKASFTDPVVNRGYRELAEHYGFLIDPCLPYHPEHKGGVESDIKYVKRNFFAEFRMKQKNRGRDIPLGDDCLPALRQWERTIADVRIIKSIGASPNELFEHEAESLRGLPAERFDLVVWAKTTVREKGRITFDRSRYSAPDRYIGKDVLIAANSRKIRIFFNYELIAEHERSLKPNRDIINPDHLGARARAYIEHTRENLLVKARYYGPAVHDLCRILLDDPVMARERSVRGIITLAKTYGPGRVNAACSRALTYDAPRYDTVKRILHNNLDLLAHKHPADSHGQMIFAFARKAGYFDTSSHTTEDHQ
jgi:hypothetical protein